MPSRRVRKVNIVEIVGEEYRRGMTVVVNELADIGYRCIKSSYDRAKFEDRTKNLKTSYASAVYVDGILMEDSIRYLGGGSAERDDRFDKTGREYAYDYLHEVSGNHALKQAQIVILCIAAMPYAEYLEKGTYNLAPRRYYGEEIGFRTTGKADNSRDLGAQIRVISGAQDELNANIGYIRRICERVGFKIRGKRIVAGDKVLL